MTPAVNPRWRHFMDYHAKFGAYLESLVYGIGSYENPNYRESCKRDCTCRNCGAPEQGTVCDFCKEPLSTKSNRPSQTIQLGR